MRIHAHILPDVIAPNLQMTTGIANLKQMMKDNLRLHPIVTRRVDAETLEKMGARKVDQGDAK